MITRPKDNTFNKILNDLKNQAYITAFDHGFHDKEHSDNHFLMLVITELAEAVEADRKGKYADINGFKFASSVMNKGRRVHSDVEVYNDYIKGTVEEELADAVIRLLDLAGSRDIQVSIDCIIDEAMQKADGMLFQNMPFPDCIYDIVLDVTEYGRSLHPCINISLARIFALAESRDIDLLWHINEKMKYNQTRERLHGKLY